MSPVPHLPRSPHAKKIRRGALEGRAKDGAGDMFLLLRLSFQCTPTPISVFFLSHLGLDRAYLRQESDRIERQQVARDARDVCVSERPFRALKACNV